MKKLAIAAAAVIGLGSMTPDVAEARSGRNAAIAAGVAGAVIGGLIASQAHAAPAYGQSYGYPAHGYRPVHGYRSAPVYDDAPNYDRGYQQYGYKRPVEYRRVRRHYDDYAYERPVVKRKVIIERRYEPVYRDYDDDGYGW